MDAESFYTYWIEQGNNHFDIISLMEAYQEHRNKQLNEEIEQLKHHLRIANNCFEY